MSREESFRAAMNAHGIEYSGELYFDGRLHRFKADGDHARNSWYVVHAGPPAAGAFGCWKRDIKETWCERRGNFSQAELQCIRKQIKEAESKGKKETVARQKKAAKIATWILLRAKPVESHPYLEAKQTHANGELRQYRDALVLPLRDLNGELRSLQFIGADGEKRFLTGGRVAGCSFTLADTSKGPLMVVEGFATGASVHEATGYAMVCALNSGNLSEVSKAVRELWPQREIVIAADNDRSTGGNPGLTKATAAAKAIRAKLAIPKFRDTSGTDFNDLASIEGLDVVREQIDAAQKPTETDGDIFERLAALAPADYDRCREREAATLGIRVKTLDEEIERRRRSASGNGNGSSLQGGEVVLPNVEPWDTPVNGAEILNEVAATYTRYLVLPPGADDGMALWTAHTHAFEAFIHTPRFNLCSPDKQCGKTTALDVIETMTPRPLHTENITAAVLFRLVEGYKPTLLLDEVDAYLEDADELRGLLNAGHKRGAMALRCEGENNTVRGFSAFAPAALAGIGALPGTLHDRSIVVKLVRAKPNEVREQFDSRQIERETELCRKLARFIADNFEKLRKCDPRLPETAFNRLADNWRPLFAIAEIAGGDWPERAASAFASLTATDDLDARGVGTLLLADISAIFAEEAADRLSSARLAELLVAIEGRPWAEWDRQRKPISPNQLANQLRRFGISPQVIRIGDETPRGYMLDDFSEAFMRYLPETPFSKCNSATTLGKIPVFEVQQPESVLHPVQGKTPILRQ